MMIFVIIVIALITVAGIYGGQALMGSSKSSTAIQEVAQVTANIQGAYANQSTFSTLTVPVAISDKLVPANMISGTSIVNPYGGTIALGPDATYPNGFDLTENGLDSGSCASLATGVTAYAVDINGTQVATGNQAVDPATAASDCTQAGTGNTVMYVETQANG